MIKHCWFHHKKNQWFLIHLKYNASPGQHCSFYDMDTNSVRANFHQSCREYVIPCPVVYYSNSIFKCKYLCRNKMLNSQLSNWYMLTLMFLLFIIKSTSNIIKKHSKIKFSQNFYYYMDSINPFTYVDKRFQSKCKCWQSAYKYIAF